MYSADETRPGEDRLEHGPEFEKQQTNPLTSSKFKPWRKIAIPERMFRSPLALLQYPTHTGADRFAPPKYEQLDFAGSQISRVTVCRDGFGLYRNVDEPKAPANGKLNGLGTPF